MREILLTTAAALCLVLTVPALAQDAGGSTDSGTSNTTGAALRDETSPAIRGCTDFDISENQFGKPDPSMQGQTGNEVAGVTQENDTGPITPNQAVTGPNQNC